MQVFLNKEVKEYLQWVPRRGKTVFALKVGDQGLLKGIGIDPGDALIFERTGEVEDGTVCVILDETRGYRLIRHYSTPEAYLGAPNDSPFEPFVGGQVLGRYVGFLKHR